MLMNGARVWITEKSAWLWNHHPPLFTLWWGGGVLLITFLIIWLILK